MLDAATVPQAMSAGQEHPTVLFVHREKTAPIRLKMCPVCPTALREHSARKEWKAAVPVQQDTTVVREQSLAPSAQVARTVWVQLWLVPTCLTALLGLSVWQGMLGVQTAMQDTSVLQAPAPVAFVQLGRTAHLRMPPRCLIVLLAHTALKVLLSAPTALWDTTLDQEQVTVAYVQLGRIAPALRWLLPICRTALLGRSVRQGMTDAQAVNQGTTALLVLTSAPSVLRDLTAVMSVLLFLFLLTALLVGSAVMGTVRARPAHQVDVAWFYMGHTQCTAQSALRHFCFHFKHLAGTRSNRVLSLALFIFIFWLHKQTVHFYLQLVLHEFLYQQTFVLFFLLFLSLHFS